jgi:hypothetical protein
MVVFPCKVVSKLGTQGSEAENIARMLYDGHYETKFRANNINHLQGACLVDYTFSVTDPSLKEGAFPCRRLGGHNSLWPQEIQEKVA